jgi:hypothetical protein
MRPNIHSDFILSPITDILKDVVSASAGIGNGIETFPLCDYVMQSVFIKMTGFQEQKMKCVCWELATVDYEYRYEFTKNPLGECSSYTEKQSIYKGLVEQIKKRSPNITLLADNERDLIITKINTEMPSIFNETNLTIWSQKRFTEFKSIWSGIEKKHFANDGTNLFTEINNGVSLKKIYKEHLYKNRNRIAHNTQSYQQNLPTLKTLINEDYKFENYFIWFSTLVLIDEIFRSLYKEYLNTFDDN